MSFTMTDYIQGKPTGLITYDQPTIFTTVLHLENPSLHLRYNSSLSLSRGLIQDLTKSFSEVLKLQYGYF